MRDARRYLDKYKRVDAAIDAFYSDPSGGSAARAAAASTSKITQLFDQYKGACFCLRVWMGGLQFAM